MTCGNEFFRTFFLVSLDMFPIVPYVLPMAPKITTEAEKLERERVGATLRTLREKEGWKLGDFATQLDISYAYLSNIEAGRKRLPNHLLARAAKLLGCTPIAIRHPDVVAGEVAS